MQVKIQDLKDVTISGVNVAFTDTCEAYKEDFFEWTAFPVVTGFKTGNIMSGLLQGWHHTPNFDKIEYHADAEQFYFTEGTALMLFIDIKDGKPAMDTAQIVRIPAGTQLDIAAAFQQLVGRAGMPQPMKYDLLKLWVNLPPLTVPLGQQLRRNG